MTTKRISYLEVIRRAHLKDKYQDEKPIPPTFFGVRQVEDVWARLEFAEKCVEHERAQLRKTTEILRRVEAQRDELLRRLGES